MGILTELGVLFMVLIIIHGQCPKARKDFGNAEDPSIWQNTVLETVIPNYQGFGDRSCEKEGQLCYVKTAGSGYKDESR